ncbi:MAG: hypothetical protein R3B70_02080 [Polyangiaceae bacterium]
MKCQIQGATLAGAMRMLDGGAPFARAAAIIRTPDNALVRVQRWEGDEAVGDLVGDEDFDNFVASKQAFRWIDISDETVPVVPHIAVWILQAGFEAFMPHDDVVAETAGKRAFLTCVRAQASWALVIAVREDMGNPLRDEWATRAFDRAWQHAAKQEWSAAAQVADISFVTTRGLRPERTALYALALEKIGEKTESEAVLTMAAESRDATFAREMLERLVEYRQSIESIARLRGAGSKAGSEPPPRTTSGRLGISPEVHRARSRALRSFYTKAA